EIIQNADDACATEVKFYLDCRVLQTLPPSLLSVVCSEANQEVLSQQFTGPALLSYNNAPFRKEDRESIQSLQQSGKAKNPHKVGKFGIGFNSVYHITDLPVILSQDYCGFLEPQESVWKGESGKGYYLENLIDECPEVLEPFDGICGFSKESTQYNNNTLFRFPLRNKASKLSSEVYDIDRLHKLLESLKEEAQYLLVFLRSVCSIEIFKITESNVTEPLFKVSVSEADFGSRLKQQRRLVSQVESIFLGELSRTVGQLVNDTSHFHIHISINGRFTSEHEWLVVNQVGSKDDEVMHLAEKQRVLPWVGAAVDLKTSCSAGRIFCVLPLPVEDRAPMCIHVNEPFIFVLPQNLRVFSSLFSRCGVPHNVTTEQILSVLQSVRDSSELKEDEAWSKVRAVLDWIADNTGRVSKANILVPVESDLSYPQLIPIDDVAYTDNEMLRGIARTSDEKYNLIHPKVSYLSSKLDLSPLSDQLDITEDVFEDAGQHEPLTTRLSNILREYKDGLTIIKEMIQNADDAGATEVNILHDTRTHSSLNLVLEGMAESHGPALIVHNNSTFTKEDFENITKLAGATKANQPLKIGKFGVGFCSVYHITDVPSFVSGEWLYIFDPTLKHLKGVVQNENRPGKKLKFQSKFLAKSQQLAPYQGLFGFDSSASYNGTIFRLPFRTHPSQISSTIYNNHLIQMIKKDLESNGSKLLLFLQNVKRITFSSRQEDRPIIKHLSIECINDETENVKVCVTQSSTKSTEYWLLSNQEQRLKSQDGAYKQAVASVACKLVKKQSSFLCEAIEGNAFCFLPLSVPATGLPVHVTANFAVMSNRSGIWAGASSAMASDEREYWNKQLMTTIIAQAYCNLLKKHSHREHVQIDPVPPELCQTHFLPILHKPDKYILSWKGEGHILLPPCQVISVDSRSLRKAGILIGSQKAIVNTKTTVSGGCDSIPHQALKLMNIPSQASFDDVHNQFVTLINTFNISMCDDLEAIQLIEEICRNVYEHFEASLKESPRVSRKLNKHQNQDDNQYKTILAQYHNKPFIWTGRGFVCPCDVSINWKQLVGPYLYKLPGMLSQHRNLVNCLQVKESFSIEKLLGTFSQMYSDFSPTHKLPQEYHETANNIVQELNTRDVQELTPMKEKAILVDANYILRQVSQLVFNDAAWLPPNNDSNYVIPLFIRKVALALGVQPTSSKFLDKYTSAMQSFSGIPFGQREELTQRIKNILRDYPLDVTFLKELLQNADDAKASKMYVILDKREHRKQRLPSENWAELQGPALLVWNDKEFTEKDLDGIQKLGLGSKRDDEESIGQFGIGFNVVYHITECPSFITRGNTLCVFDPHCRYVYGADKLCPGRRYNIDDSFWDSMSDLRSCFLQDELQNKPQGLDKGSLFRFPLRCTKEQVMKSELVNNAVRTEPLTADIMEKYLNLWVNTMKDALLFLNHIVQFEYYVIEKSGSIKCETSYVVHMEGNAHEMRASLKEQFAAFKQTKKPFLVTYPLKLETKLLKFSTHEQWLIQQGVGDVQDPHNEHWEYLNKTLPKHGIAATHKRTENFYGKVFCFLPLPVYTELPVHINGQFVLNSDRRSLWASTTNKHDSKTKWNANLIKAIASSYVCFLEKAKYYYVNGDGYGTRSELLDAINNYYSLFPFFDPPFIFKKKEEKSEMPYRTSQVTVVSQSPSRKHDVARAKKKNWEDICSMVFQLMWQENLQLLAAELKKDEVSQTKSQPLVSWVAQWHRFRSDIPQNQAYFKSTASKEVKQVLRQLGMILTCAPPILCSHLQSQEVQPAVLSRGSVYDYYSKFHTQIIGKCPCPINQSPFKTMDNLCFFLNYLLSVSFKGIEMQYEFPHFPEGIPLLLTADSQLRLFTDPPEVLCSNYAQLFKNSSSWILHEGIMKAVGKLSSTYFISNLSSEVLDKMMISNFSSSMKSSVVENTNHCIITKEKLMELWLCLCHDPIISQYRQCIVNSWAIIPSVSGKLYSANSRVLPLLEPTSPIYIGAFDKLTDLNVPQFDSTNYANCSAKDYCVDVSHVSTVLSVLFHHHCKTKVLSNLKAPQKTIQCLFQYFSRINFAHDSDSLDYIQRLPLFETVNGDITSLRNKQVYRWPIEACKAGYSKWASSDKVIFLPVNGEWRILCNYNIEVLGGQHLTERELYIRFIFPVFQILTSDERMEHLKHIKDTLFSDLQYESQLKKASRRAPAIDFIEKLKKLPCLETSHGNLQAIKEFSDHNMLIFTTFSQHFLFVPKEYQEDEWLEFLKALGLRVTITTEEFKLFATIVSTAKHKNVSNASSVLVEYLFSDSAKEWHTDKYILSDIAKIAFAKVANLSNLEWIKKSCQPPLYLEGQKLGLTMLNKSVINDSASLIWTVKPVVNLPVPPYMYFSTSQQYCTLLEYLGVTLKPDSEDVYENLINVSQTGLAKFDLFHKYNSAYLATDNDRVSIEAIIKRCFDYLFEHKAHEQLKSLFDVPCIPVSAVKSQNTVVIYQPVLVKPIQVPQADPIKAGYWLKQAECDLKAMLILNQNEGMQCQVLFLCHETCEKALKAGMYKLVGLNSAYLKSHELLTHAYAIAGMKGGDWAELPSLVHTIETEQYYLKTRYPNQHYPSVAPVDIYCHYTKDDEVLSVVNSAQKLIKLIQRLF
uniref:Uncharacterized protein n=1 Tax=Amphimedon queenslandica TaxID=400682 RepID=A0A1X7TK44_AMPQE